MIWLMFESRPPRNGDECFGITTDGMHIETKGIQPHANRLGPISKGGS
jgi:hypothetical protein